MPSHAAPLRRPIRGALILGALVVCLFVLVLAGCGGGTPDAPLAAGDNVDIVQAAEIAPPRIPSDAIPFEPTSGSFSISIPSTWQAPPTGLDVAEAVWFSDAGSSDFDANVNVIVEPLPAALPITRYLDLSVENAPRLVDGFEIIDKSAVMLTSGELGGRFEYRGRYDGNQFHFLAIVSINENVAVTATYTNLDEQYEKTVGDVEPYLLTLAAKSTAAASEPAATGEQKKKQQQKKKKKKATKA